MAITPLTSPWKTLTFDGETSASYGVSILGEGVFDAPERAVKQYSIPGRNGKFNMDLGYFDNIKVTYPATLVAGDTTDFANGISAFRNFLCSKKGYCRLTDDYNPSEYRMAVYRSGLEVDEKVLQAGEFDITFDCKPQRYLTSGETATAVTDGATLTNPTLFEAKPLIEAVGYGEISLAGQIITVQNSPLGNIELMGINPATSFSKNNPAPSIAYSFDGSLVNNGDALYLYSATFGYVLGGSGTVSAMSVSAAGGFDYAGSDLANRTFSLAFYGVNMVKGTPFTRASTASLSYTYNGGTGSQTVTCTLAYDGNQTITLSLSQFVGHGTLYANPRAGTNQLDGDSSVNAAGTLYIDCENGLAWWDESGTIADANGAVSFPNDLPVLATGANVINFDNTFTSVKIAPRWWIV